MAKTKTTKEKVISLEDVLWESVLRFVAQTKIKLKRLSIM